MQLVTVQWEKQCAFVALNRPEKRNALNAPLMEALLDALTQVEKARVVILRGEGKVFSAGFDLKEGAGDELVAKILARLYTFPAVTIAAIQGAALAGGAGLAAACDFVVMEKNALLGFPEVRRGLVPAQVMSCLIRKLGTPAIKELALLGDPVSAEKAKEWGFATMVVEGNPLEGAKQLADRILKGAPEAQRQTKKLLLELDRDAFSRDLKTGFAYHILARQSHEAKEGVRAFLEGRPSVWE